MSKNFKPVGPTVHDMQVANDAKYSGKLLTHAEAVSEHQKALRQIEKEAEEETAPLRKKAEALHRSKPQSNLARSIRRMN